MEKRKLSKPCPSCPAHVFACGVCAAHMVMGLQLHEKYCFFFAIEQNAFQCGKGMFQGLLLQWNCCMSLLWLGGALENLTYGVGYISWWWVLFEAQRCKPCTGLLW
jgi:hypothetical protein